MSSRHHHHLLGERDRRRLAVQADPDPRTVRRWLTGEPIRPAMQARIERAYRTMILRGELPDVLGLDAGDDQ